MEQYRICRLKGAREGFDPDYVVILQRDLLSDIKTRVAAPLLPFGQVVAASQLHPRITIDDMDYVLMIERLAAISITMLVETPYRADAIRDEITRAIDILFTG